MFKIFFHSKIYHQFSRGFAPLETTQTNNGGIIVKNPDRNKKFLTGFTLIELLVVIAIIGLLASVVLVALNSARVKSRDTKRLADMAQIQKALALYYDKNNRYPDSDFQGCGGWDTPGDGDFINALITENVTKTNLKDPSNNYDCGNYRYYRYPPQGDCLRNFFVLGVVDMENSGNPHPQSPGWKCTGAGARDWQGEMEWVIGGFE